jgi:hypothetical protein
MHERFRMMVEALHPSYNKLLAMQPVPAAEVQLDTPCGGVYLFSEGGVHLYAGRTKRPLGRRIRDHFGSAPDCPLAWLLTRESTGRKASYKREGSRKVLLQDPTFRAEYDAAKLRIRAMSVRWVVEADPTTQALLEIYVAVATGARYNDFDTH